MLEKLFEAEKAKAFLEKFSFLSHISIVDWVINDGINFVGAAGGNDLDYTIINEWNDIIQDVDGDFNSYLLNLVDFNSHKTADTITQQPDSIESFVKKAYELSMLFKENSMESSLKLKGVSEKKCYEIDVMSKVINAKATKSSIYNFVDVGAGRCYVTRRLLGFNELYKVTCIDNQKGHIDGAKKKMSNFSDRITFITENFSSFKGDSPYGIYSLHACGSLSDRIIEAFVNDKECKLLINVGCCYNLICDEVRYSKEMKMMACQSPYKWKSDIKGSNLFLKRNFYRSLLQYMYDKNCSNDDDDDHNHASSGRIGNGIGDQYLDSFSTYVEKATENYVKRWKVKPPWIGFDLVELYSEKKHLHRSLSFFWAMRAILGVVIESLIIYDRYIFIKESLDGGDCDCEIMAIFDPHKSPRSYAIIANKKK